MKPFALMVENLASTHVLCEISGSAQTALTSSAALAGEKVV
jgi:hydrogenase maturation factor HypF (carbamoyltransferase family)